MLPERYPYNLNAIYESWKSIFNGNRGHTADGDTDPSVLRSWNRCRKFLDPHSKPAGPESDSIGLDMLRKENEFLINTSVTFLEDCYQYVGNTKSVFALTDASGRFLFTLGNSSMKIYLEKIGVRIDGVWSEDAAGTNAVALCLETVMPTQVVGAEHYLACMHSLASTASPIHYIDGRVIGTVALIIPVQDAHPGAISMIMTISRAVENCIQTGYYLAEANSRRIEMQKIMSSIDDGIIAWNSSGIITHINAKAEQIMQLSAKSVQGKWVGSVMHLPEPIRYAWEKGIERKDIETAFSIANRSISVLASLLPYKTDAADGSRFILTLRNIADVRRLVNKQTGMQTGTLFKDITVESAAMKRILKQANAAARSDSPILIKGEEGVGRMQLAHAIHNEGKRAGKPFLAINCAAIPGALMVQEFMGEGSSRTNPGRPSKFELAEGGTLLLDRVETLTVEMQSALVHFIENGYLMRLKSDEPVPVNVRIIAVTSADLDKMVMNGSFNRALYYALFNISIFIPALRERTEDIKYAAVKYLDILSTKKETQFHIEKETMNIMRRYYWPGNFREMENALEMAAGQCTGGEITLADLPEAIKSGRLRGVQQEQTGQMILSAAEAEREAIFRAGWVTSGNINEMASLLGLSRTTLWRRMKTMDITGSQFKKS